MKTKAEHDAGSGASLSGVRICGDDSMNGTIELKTERLLLRRHCRKDAAILFRNFGLDAKMYEYSGWNPYATEKMAEETVQRFLDSYDNPFFYGWAIERNGALIGTVGAYDFDEDNSRIEVGMSIERASWGNGFASEALTCILRYLTEHEQIHTVTAWCASDNIGSMRAMQKSGMVQTDMERGALEIHGERYDKLIFEYAVER